MDKEKGDEKKEAKVHFAYGICTGAGIILVIFGLFLWIYLWALAGLLTGYFEGYGIDTSHNLILMDLRSESPGGLVIMVCGLISLFLGMIKEHFLNKRVEPKTN